MSSYTINCNPQQFSTIQTKLKHAKDAKVPPYAVFAKKMENCTITGYQSGKILFQGSDAKTYYELLGGYSNDPINTPNSINTFPQSGSDEVGTGDYFGPIVVVACTIDQQQANKYLNSQITDSKKLNDDLILQLGESLIREVIHTKLILSNEKYNTIHETLNMNAIKAYLHNQAYINLTKRLGGTPPNIIIDQFCTPKNYFNYLKTTPQVVRDIHFETKAESKYLAVAIASIIARYYFLKAFEQMQNQYDFPFLKGASSKVDSQIVEFVDKYDRDTLLKVAKVHFINTQKALD